MAAERLLQRVMAAHGGHERWRRARALRVDVRCGGAALTARFQRNAYRRYRALLDTRRPRVRFTPFKGHHGVFTPERVWIETDQGAVVQERAHPRHFFPSWRRHIVWDRLDVLYFGGYAMWNYLCTPFLWHSEDIQLTEGDPWQTAGETCCPEQIFYIDDRGYIRRHDYTARVIGPYARAVHISDDHRRFDGLVFPTRRRVYPRRRDNRSLPFPTLIWIDIDHIEVIDE